MFWVSHCVEGQLNDTADERKEMPRSPLAATSAQVPADVRRPLLLITSDVDVNWPFSPSTARANDEVVHEDCALAADLSHQLPVDRRQQRSIRRQRGKQHATSHQVRST